jgi:hypothetical protein
MATDPTDWLTRDLFSGIEQSPMRIPLWLRPTVTRLTDNGREVSYRNPEDQAQVERLTKAGINPFRL